MWSDHVRWEDVSEEGRKSAPIDLRNASLEDMLLLEGIGEVSAKKIISIRGTGMPLTMYILRKIPHFNIKRVQALIDRGLVRPLQPDEKDVKSAVASTAEPWMSILKSERADRDCLRLDRDQYRMRVEPQKYMRQKEAELDHLLKIKEIEMEKKLRRLFYAGTSRGRTSDKRSPIVTSTPRQTTSTPDDGSSATRSHSNTREMQKPRQPTTTTTEDASSVEMRKPSTARQPTTATSEDASSVEMRKPGIPRQPTTTTSEDASSVEMRKPIIPEQLTTSNREEASSVEMRKPDTRTYISSRDIRTPVAAMSVTPDGVMVEPPEDLPSSDDSRSSDIASEYASDMSDEAQARSRGSDQYPRHSSPMHKNEHRHPRSPPVPKLPPTPQLPTEETENEILGQLSMQDKPPPQSRSPSRISTSVKCLPPGHFTGECPSVLPPNTPGRIRCLKCQDYGHVQRDCSTSETSIVFPNDPGLGH